MDAVLFFIAGIGAVAGAIGVVALNNPFYSVLSLVSHLFALAVLFLLLMAQFVAAAQIVVYAGAVMVLYVFVVAYIGGSDQPVGPQAGDKLVGVAIAAATCLFVVLIISLLGTGLAGVDSEGAELAAGFGQPGQIGELLLTKFLLPFEIASFLLLVAAVGAVVLARRRGSGADADGTVTVAELFRVPAGTGSMREGLGRPTGTNPRQETPGSPREGLPTPSGVAGEEPS
ncbi:MAG: NADH-quinone oxidoreductase subunit [Solirubrobacteraceae bacterium]|jgi:NADH-quinone oxidoreductase subunit J|nr:NADH-quinone oxidoreductase subunit [Solirubrobacteraceae bacterium]